MPEFVCIKFLEVPVETMFRAAQHQQELVREFTLIQLSDDAAKKDLPSRLLDMVERHRREFSTLSFRASEDIGQAMANGRLLIDMEIDVPITARAAAQEMLATLAEADDFCRRGDLLTLATTADLVMFREWFLGEIVRQIDGTPATPYE